MSNNLVKGGTSLVCFDVNGEAVEKAKKSKPLVLISQSFSSHGKNANACCQAFFLHQFLLFFFFFLFCLFQETKQLCLRGQGKNSTPTFIRSFESQLCFAVQTFASRETFSVKIESFFVQKRTWFCEICSTFFF